MIFKKLVIFIFCIMVVGSIYAENTNHMNGIEDLNDAYEDMYIEDYDISPEDLEIYIEDYDISPEDLEKYIQNQDVQQIISDIITPEFIITSFYNNLDIFKEIYNQEIITEIPDFVKKIYNNQSYKLVLITENKEYDIFLDFKEEHLENVSQTQIREKIDLTISVSENVFETFINISQYETEEEIVYKIREHIVNKDINLRPHGFINSIKYGVFSVLRFMLSF